MWPRAFLDKHPLDGRLSQVLSCGIIFDIVDKGQRPSGKSLESVIPLHGPRCLLDASETQVAGKDTCLRVEVVGWLFESEEPHTACLPITPFISISRPRLIPR